MKKYFLLLLPLFLFLLSCEEKAVYESFASLDNEEWLIGHPVTFEAELPEKGEYDITLYVRHTTDYELANLWCFLQVTDSTGHVRRDSVNILLAEPDGRWIGDGHTLKNVGHPLTSLPMPAEAGKYTFSVEQGMRTRALKGVRDVGVVIRKRE